MGLPRESIWGGQSTNGTGAPGDSAFTGLGHQLPTAYVEAVSDVLRTRHVTGSSISGGGIRRLTGGTVDGTQCLSQHRDRQDVEVPGRYEQLEGRQSERDAVSVGTGRDTPDRGGRYGSHSGRQGRERIQP